MWTLNRGISIPPMRQVQSPNCYAVLATLGDTVLDDKLTHRNYRIAYQDPELLGYKVSRVSLVSEQAHITHLPGKHNRGHHNHRN